MENNNQQTDLKMINSTNYQTDDSGFSADSCASSLGNFSTSSAPLNNQTTNSKLIDDKNETVNYLLLDNLNRLDQNNQINKNLIEKNDQLDNQIDNQLDKLNQTILQNKILNEQSIKNELNMKSNYLDQIDKLDNNLKFNHQTEMLNELKLIDLNNLDRQIEQTNSHQSNGQTTDQLTENNLKLQIQQQNYLESNLDDNNYQVMYQTPNLDTMDIYYPSDTLLSIDYPLKDSTAIDKQFYNANKTLITMADDTVYHSFNTENICNNLTTPAVNNTICDDYVVTFL